MNSESSNSFVLVHDDMLCLVFDGRNFFRNHNSQYLDLASRRTARGRTVRGRRKRGGDSVAYLRLAQIHGVKAEVSSAAGCLVQLRTPSRPLAARHDHMVATHQRLHGRLQPINDCLVGCYPSMTPQWQYLVLQHLEPCCYSPVLILDCGRSGSGFFLPSDGGYCQPSGLPRLCLQCSWCRREDLDGHDALRTLGHLNGLHVPI